MRKLFLFMVLVLMFVSSVSAYSTYNHYNFSNTLIDQQKRINLTFYGVGSATYGIGESGNAINLSGKQYLRNSTSNNYPAMNDLTIMVWIKPKSYMAYGAIVNGRTNDDTSTALTGINFRASSSSATDAIACTGQYSGSSGKIANAGTGDGFNWSTTQWNHFACVYHNTGVAATTWAAIYENGVLLKNSSAGANFGSASFVLRVGSDSNNLARNYTGLIDEVRLYKSALTKAQIVSEMNNFTSPVAGTNTYTVNVNWAYNFTDLSGATVQFYNSGVLKATTLSATNGDAINVSSDSTFQYMNVTISKSGFYTVSILNVPANNTRNVNLTMRRYNATVTAITSGVVVSLPYNCTVQGGRTFTSCLNMEFLNTSGNVTFKKSGWNWKKQSVSAGASPSSGSFVIVGAWNATFRVNIKNSAGASLLVATVVNATRLNAPNVSYKYQNTSSGGYVYFYGLTGSYNITDLPTGYAVASKIVSITNGTIVTLTNYLMNSFNISIFNESSNNKITGRKFYIQLISSSYSMNYSTTNGSKEINLLVPGSYEIRYWANQTYTVPRSYFVTLTNNSYNNIRLYSVMDNVSTYFTPVILDEYGGYCNGALIQLIRGYISNGTMTGYSVEMALSDPTGSAVMRLEPNTVYYKFIFSGCGGSLVTNYFKIGSSTLRFQLLPGSNYLTSRVLMNQEPFNLSFNNLTNTFSFVWSDTSNLISQGCLKVVKSDKGVDSVVANSCASASTGSIIYTVTDTNETVYTATSKVVTSGADRTVVTDSLVKSYKLGYVVWGLLGVFLTLLVTLFFMFLFGGSTEGVVFGGFAGICVMGMIGVFAWEWTSIVGIGIVAVIIAYKTRT